jgi:very-short-patch-repair endonuclease
VFRAGRRTIARVDFYWPDHRLVVEVSGQLGHSTPRDRARDARRRNELQELGLDVFEFTFAQVMDEPAVVIRAVRRRLSPLAAVPA